MARPVGQGNRLLTEAYGRSRDVSEQLPRTAWASTTTRPRTLSAFGRLHVRELAVFQQNLRRGGGRRHQLDLHLQQGRRHRSRNLATRHPLLAGQPPQVKMSIFFCHTCRIHSRSRVDCQRVCQKNRCSVRAVDGSDILLVYCNAGFGVASMF